MSAPKTTTPTATYGVRISGFWNSTHRLETPEGPLGVLKIERNGWGMVVGGRYSPTKGEVLVMRRDPGLLRSQYSMPESLRRRQARPESRLSLPSVSMIRGSCSTTLFSHSVVMS